jgi:hypothetical protein
MQIGGEDIEFLVMNMVLKKKTFKRHNSKKRAFPLMFFFQIP